VRRSICAAMALVLTAIPVIAQTSSGALTLDDCIRLAQSAPSAITLARQQTEIARYGLVQARANFLPQFSVGNSFIYNSPSSPGSADAFSFVALNGVREYTSLGSASLELDTSGRLRALQARARAEQDAAAANLGLTRRDLRRTVASAYYRLLLGRHLVQSAREVLREAQSFERRTKLLFQNGEAAQADVVKASAEVAFLEQALTAAELEARIANHELASFWTTNVEDALSLVDVLDQPAVPPEAPAGAPFLKRLEFQFLDAQRRGFVADARRARAERLPQMSLVTQYGIDSLHARIRDRGYASFVHLNIPVFDWFRARGATRQFRLQAQQVETNRQITERAFSRDYRDALARVELIFSQISITGAQVKLSEDNLRLSRIRYEGGEGSALEVVTAHTQLAQARSNYFTVKAGYLNARVELEVAAGR
jgi:outer membrane protein